MPRFSDLSGFVAAHPDAAGLSSLRPGTAWTPLEDQALALGWPIVRFLDESEDVDVEAALAATQKAYPSYGVRWPLAVAARLLRQWCAPAGSAVSSSSEALSEDEARAFTAKVVVSGAGGAYDQNEDTVLLLEAFAGPAVVLDSALGALEAVDDSRWLRLSHLSYATLVPLGVMLERLPAPIAASQRDRLASLLARHPPVGDAFATHALRLVVEGAPALAHSGQRLADGRLNARFCITAADPAALAPIIEAERDLQGRHEARLAWLGGDAAVRTSATHWTRAKKPPALARLVETLGVFRHDAVVTMLLAMTAAGKAKKAVQAWCVAHPEVARAEFSKVSGPLAPAAAALLAKL